MGNSESGFNMPPKGYLREIRRETSKRFRTILTTQKRPQYLGHTEEIQPKGKKLELNSASVKEYVISNPSFLDDLIKQHISQDRVRAWLKESTDETLERMQATDQERKSTRESVFAAEVAERSLRQRKILVVTRNHLSFPFRYRLEEFSNLIARPYSASDFPEIDNHTFPYTEIYVEDINRVFIKMVTDLLGRHAFPMTELCYFLTTLKVNYFNVEYHNYSHALSHAQSMFWMLKKNPGIFSELEMKALMIASISHDAGHPGLNERYLKSVGSGLERMYHTPLLENHHVQTCFLILQDINCNIFCDLDYKDYKQILREIRFAIRSTDINMYKSQCETLRQFIGSNLDLEKKEVRNAVKAIMMMSCDLCAAWKRWPEHKNTVWSLYKEFFNQGDREMGFGIDSPPQMMRINAEEIPKYQTVFLQNVVHPIFLLLENVFPNLKVISSALKENLEFWQSYHPE